MSHHRSVLERFRVPAVILLVAMLVAVSSAMLMGIRSSSASARWVNHTHEVIGQIQALRSTVRTAESTARGYRLAGLPGLRAQYGANRPLALDAVNALANLVSDNPPQHRRARRLVRLVEARLGEIDRTLELHRAGQAEAAVALSRTGEGLRLMGEIDNVADAMRDAEERLLVAREVAVAENSARLAAFVVTGMLLSLTMLAVLLTTVARENRRSRRLGEEARAALATLEASTTQRERLAEQRRVLGAFAGLLHSCQGVDEALSIAGNALQQLVPHGAGVCYSMRASQNVLEMHPLFGTHGSEYGDVMRPDQCWALRRGSTHTFDPARPTAICEHLRSLPTDAACGACVPLASQGSVLGLLHVSARDGSSLNDLERAAVESVGEHLAVVLYSLQLRESLRVQSLRDPLTGLYNRRYLEESLPREMERCQRRDRPLSVLMLDVDYFKRFNDEHGHAAGDALLTRIGEALATVTRGEDIACRFGGEEFTIVMPEANLEQATLRAEQIRIAIAEASVTYMRRELGQVTASIGVHELRPGIDTPESLIATADRALYAAKAQGRNRVLQAGGVASAHVDVSESSAA